MNTRFYAIYEDLSFMPFVNVYKAAESQPYLILEVKEHYKSGVDRDFEFSVWTKSKYEKFFRGNSEIKVGEWSLVNARSVRSHFDTENIGFDVADPTGELRLDFFGKAISEKGIVKAIEFLRKVSQFKNWKDFEDNQRKSKIKRPSKRLRSK